jgi:hypothetical protein
LIGRWSLATSLLSALLLSGCASTRLPLCPSIAAKSYPAGHSSSDVNWYTREQATRLGISISPVSAFAADFRGADWDVRWLQRNYPFMLCAFDPRQEVNVRSTYISCMRHAEEWIRRTQSKVPEDLMLEGVMFHENCSIDFSRTGMAATRRSVAALR